MIAAAICTPTDVLKIRMQASDYYGYKFKTTLSTFVSILQTEGLAGLYKACYATSARAGVVCAAELITYDLVDVNLTYF